MKQFFKDNDGQFSMTRLLVFMACATACLMSITYIFLEAYCVLQSTAEVSKKMPDNAAITIIGLLLTYAGAKKVLQKRIENDKGK